MTVYTTLNKIRTCEFYPCKDVLERLLPSLGKTAPDDEPLALVSILESNSLADALWCTPTVFDEHREKVVTFAIRCAENVLPIFEEAIPDDLRPRLAIQAAKDYLEGKIANTNFWPSVWAAEAAAGDAKAVAKDAAKAAARDAAWAARVAAEAAKADMYARAAEAAKATARLRSARSAVAWVADAVKAAARDAAEDTVRVAAWAAEAAAGDAEKKFQENLFREIFG